jgi:hypothetical protein
MTAPATDPAATSGRRFRSGFGALFSAAVVFFTSGGTVWPLDRIFPAVAVTALGGSELLGVRWNAVARAPIQPWVA